jgi:superfamily II DNA or RNA helicase
MIKTIHGFNPYDFQKKTIEAALETIRLNGGCLIFDQTGLGKTITAATLAVNLGADGSVGENILVVAPKNNQKSWSQILPSATICTSAKITVGQYDTVIVDEAHRFGNSKNKSHAALTDIIFFGQKFPNVILLTATPVNNNIMELFNMTKLIPFKMDSIGMALLPIAFSEAIKAEKELRKFERYLTQDENGFWNYKSDHIQENWKHRTLQEGLVRATEVLGGVLKLISFRTTRKDIEADFANDMALMGHFPKVVHNKVAYELDSEKIRKTLHILQKMPFAYHNAINYMDGNEKTGLGAIMKTLLMKLLDSSVAAFLSTLSKFRLDFGGCVEMDANGMSCAPIGVNDNFWVDLKKDIEAVYELFAIWNMEQAGLDGEKIKMVLDIIAKTEGKVVVFTEYNATQEILFNTISKHYTTIFYNGQSTESTLDEIMLEFDPNSDKNTDKYKVLIATDALSEGSNLHRASTIVHYDCKWNPSRMEQREGRVNRLFKNGIVPPQINVYTMAVESLIEQIIKLEMRIDNKTNFAVQILNSTWKPKIIPNENFNYDFDYIVRGVQNLKEVEFGWTNVGTVANVSSYLSHGKNMIMSETESMKVFEWRKSRKFTNFTPRSVNCFGYENRIRISNFGKDLGVDDIFCNYLYLNPFYGTLFDLHDKEKTGKLIQNAVQHYVLEQTPICSSAGNYMLDETEKLGRELNL